MENRIDKIICPECGKIQFAEVEATPLWDIYVHECEDCGFMITESDWEVVV